MHAALILSGCGYLDGAEIRESVFSLLALDRQGASISIFAPDAQQADVVDHRSGEASTSGNSRNVLEEAARIARGNIAPLSQLNPAEFDALIMPGGFGVAKNLSNFASTGKEMTVDETLERVIQGFFEAGKPIAAICISPVVVAAALKDKGNIRLTIGDDPGTASVIDHFGHTHEQCDTAEAVIDRDHHVASCSAYMRDDARISDVEAGIEKVVRAVHEMVHAREAERKRA